MRCCLVKLSIIHLTSERPLPNQLVKPQMILTQKRGYLLWRMENICRTNRFMGFLCIFSFAFVEARTFWNILFSVRLYQKISHPTHSISPQVHTIRTHISDQSHRLPVDWHPFIKILSKLHGPCSA